MRQQKLGLGRERLGHRAAVILAGAAAVVLLGAGNASASGTLTWSAPAASGDASAAVCEVVTDGMLPAPLYERPTTDSAILGSIGAGDRGIGCESVDGAAYTECGGGSWYATELNGTRGYVQAACVRTTA